MKRILAPQSTVVLAVAALVFTVGFGATMAWAANLQFNQASVTRSNENLVCTFKITGLGDNGRVNVECSADADATYGCINKGGKNPSAANKQEETGRVSAEGLFNSDKNGSVTGSLTVSPPPTTLSCPSGQVLRLCAVTYSAIQLFAEGVSGSATGQDDTEAVSGTFTFDAGIAGCP